jgi:hypothetical protein
VAEVVDSSAISIFCCSTNFNATIIFGKILFKSDCHILEVCLFEDFFCCDISPVNTMAS